MSDPQATAPRRITVPYRPRFDECGPEGTVRTSALLRYVQDVAWIHSERLGYDRAWYGARNLGWVVRALELAVLRPIPLGHVIDLSTEVTGMRRVWARRRSEGLLPDGTRALWAHTDWVMTDTVRGLPGRVPAEFATVFGVPPGSFEPGRVALTEPPADAFTHRFHVRPQDIDPMAHVNNATYVDYLEATLAAAGPAAFAMVPGVPRRVRIEYVLPAQPDEQLTATCWPLDRDDHGGWAWSLADADGRELARAMVLGG
jgi:acyl-ACP thioesterase